MLSTSCALATSRSTPRPPTLLAAYIAGLAMLSPTALCAAKCSTPTVMPEKPFQRRFVTNVEGFKGMSLPTMARTRPQRLWSCSGCPPTQAQSRLVEGHGGVASDVACATCDEHLGS